MTALTASEDLSDDLQSVIFDFLGSDSGSSFDGRTTPPEKAIGRQRSGEKLSMADLRFVKSLGSGDIGSVYLAEVKRSSGGFLVAAAKVMDKRELAARDKEGRARAEREILEDLDHPFLPRLYGSAEDGRWSVLLTEFCPGGDLHILRQLQPLKRFDEASVRFYVSEVVVAMEYMHVRGIIYRDLKPENVLIGSDGHVMLTDFDLSLKSSSSSSPAFAGSPTSDITSAVSCLAPAISCFHRRLRWPRFRRRRTLPEFMSEPVNVRSNSFVGTHEYLAPEIVSGEGHGSAVDWWTLGVFMFELLYGFTPFTGESNHLWNNLKQSMKMRHVTDFDMMTLANIVARGVVFPKEPTVSDAAKDLIRGLLAKDPDRRLGATLGAPVIKRHRFFDGVNWALIRCVSPPHVPPAFKTVDFSKDVYDDSGLDMPVEFY
ncbi:Serine/threonine-protein kinase AtPK7 [Acorus calamus]|uniref:non-specific serine/threonine protein kinase n=1 Tax=Acorus calamus TaxID=4465 RepID=A0AAV9EA18_ACOCL|nr:Serine/threonine-protein kinase AtPK7 [Acorus calamus]